MRESLIGDIRRIAMLNRSEAAVRFCRAVKDYSEERSTSLKRFSKITMCEVRLALFGSEQFLKVRLSRADVTSIYDQIRIKSGQVRSTQSSPMSRAP